MASVVSLLVLFYLFVAFANFEAQREHERIMREAEVETQRILTDTQREMDRLMEELNR